MSTHKHIDKICCIVVAVALLITVLFMNGEALGIRAASRAMGYETRLFDTSRVHTVDIVMDDWEGFLAACESEEYALCSVVIDGEACKNVGIRAKGNTSLSTVSSMNSDRYSFKIEFDQYDSTGSYYGLDKLSLNNIIQDTTYMKDYLTYRMMDEFGVDAPLCSYVYITVNGEDWGLYLAVEGVEDSFLRRNYGSDYGELYKPDSMSFGGGRGNGKDFKMEDFDFDSVENLPEGSGETTEDGFGRFDRDQQMPEGFDPSSMFGGNGGMGGFGSQPASGQNGGMGMGQIPGGADMPQMNVGGMGGGMGMGSSDVLLQYSGDEADSYANIFDNAKTDLTQADRTRLIEALKKLSSGEAIEDVVDVDEVLRYFVVHNFVVNGDSYTGSMIHNYYLYEKDGQLSMIPWDYNLAYGTFQSSNAQSAVNDPIDTPLSVTGDGSRPMADWIFADEGYTELYHQYFAQFLDTVDFAAMIEQAQALIAPYVERDPTKFYTCEEFETGVETLKAFCRLRAQSVRGQLDGTIPSTDAGQAADSGALVDTGSLNLSAMGSMGGGFGGNRGDGNFDRGDMTAPDGMQMPNGFPQMPDGGEMPDGGQMPDGFAPTPPGGA